MCRSIQTLFNFDPPATVEEIHASALRFVRKLSGTTAPSKANRKVEAAARRFTLIAFLVLLLSPAGFAQPAADSGLKEHWVGKHVDELVTSWGEPSKVKPRSRGVRVFVYKLRIHDEYEVDAPGWYFNESNETQSVVSPIDVPSAEIIPGPDGIKAVEGKLEVKFFVNDRARIYAVRSKQKGSRIAPGR